MPNPLWRSTFFYLHVSLSLHYFFLCLQHILIMCTTLHFFWTFFLSTRTLDHRWWGQHKVTRGPLYIRDLKWLFLLLKIEEISSGIWWLIWTFFERCIFLLLIGRRVFIYNKKIGRFFFLLFFRSVDHRQVMCVFRCACCRELTLLKKDTLDFSFFLWTFFFFWAAYHLSGDSLSTTHTHEFFFLIFFRRLFFLLPS